MADRISSEHPTVTTIRATCVETVTGVRLEIPVESADATAADAGDSLPVEEVVRFDLDGTRRFGRFDRPLTGDGVSVDGLYDSPDSAREQGGDDRLGDWIEDHDVRPGGSVLLDVVEPAFYYGLRAPGETRYYDAVERPSDSLSSIAKDLEDS